MCAGIVIKSIPAILNTFDTQVCIIFAVYQMKGIICMTFCSKNPEYPSLIKNSTLESVDESVKGESCDTTCELIIGVAFAIISQVIF